MATLLVSRSPFTTADADVVHKAARRAGFIVQVAPWDEASDARLGRIAGARTHAELAAAAADRDFDFSPPTDARPYFFNMLKPGAVFRQTGSATAASWPATCVRRRRCSACWRSRSCWSAPSSLWPLVQAGRPDLPAPRVHRRAGLLRDHRPRIHADSDPDAAAVLALPRPSDVHVLDRAVPDDSRRRLRQPRVGSPEARPRRAASGCRSRIGAAIARRDAADCGRRSKPRWAGSCRAVPLVVAAFIVPLAFALGFCFPIGMRLVGRHSDRITAWMWGVNGACGVIASILAVMGIDVARHQLEPARAAVLYALLALPMRRLAGPRAPVVRRNL